MAAKSSPSSRDNRTPTPNTSLPRA